MVPPEIFRKNISGGPGAKKPGIPEIAPPMISVESRVFFCLKFGWKMRLRNTHHHDITGFSSTFNISSMSEIIVCYDSGDTDSDYIRNWDVQLPNGEWKNLKQALKDRDVIGDNYDHHFRPALNDAERERGYYE